MDFGEFSANLELMLDFFGQVLYNIEVPVKHRKLYNGEMSELAEGA